MTCRMEQSKGISPKARGGQERAGSQPWPAPGPVQQRLEGVPSWASHTGWAQIVSRELSSVIFSNYHWALGLQPLWCQPAPQCHHALGIHTTLLTPLVKPTSAVDSGRGFYLQLGCPFLPRQCLLSGGSFSHQLPPGSQAPRDFLLLRWEVPSLAWGPSGQGQVPPHTSQHPKLDGFSGLVGRERQPRCRSPPLARQFWFRFFCILSFGLAGFSSDPGSLLACFCFLQQFPKQCGRSVLGMDIAAPTPELPFLLAVRNFPCEPEPN